MKALLFSNDGCGSCRKWKPTFIKLMDKYKIDYEVIDNFKDRERAKQYNVKGIPLTVFINNQGVELGSVLGSMLEELADRDIQYYLKKDAEGN
jgi:thiol-disulfide isomerase/thioredoxin